MDALELLKQDHRRVKALFEQVRQAGEDAGMAELRDIYDQIREELEMHTHIEETFFYPAFSQYPQFTEILEDSYEDHQEVKDLLSEIDELSDDEDEDIMDLLEELIDGVEAHIEEEEEELFPMVREVMGENGLRELGDRMQQARGDVRAAA